jgi:hypothetical protein
VHLDKANGFLDNLAAGLSMRMAGLDDIDGLVNRIFLEESQVKGNHLGRSVYSSRTVNIDILSLSY